MHHFQSFSESLVQRYADDLAVIAETEEELIKRLNDNNDRLTAFDPGQPG